MARGPITRSATDVRKVGNNLAVLANVADTVAGTKTLKAVDLSFGKKDGSEAEEAVYAIGEALAVSEITQTGGSWKLGDQIGRDDGATIQSTFKVTVVFEEPGQAILLVPDKDNLQFGLQDPPMHEFPYVAQLEGVQNEMKAMLEGLCEKIKLLPEVASAGLADKIDTATESFIGTRLKPLTNTEKVDVFHEQLGAYSCRQCG